MDLTAELLNVCSCHFQTEQISCLILQPRTYCHHILHLFPSWLTTSVYPSKPRLILSNTETYPELMWEPRGDWEDVHKILDDVCCLHRALKDCSCSCLSRMLNSKTLNFAALSHCLLKAVRAANSIHQGPCCCSLACTEFWVMAECRGKHFSVLDRCVRFFFLSGQHMTCCMPPLL